MQRASMQHSVSHGIIETQVGLRHHYLAELFSQVMVVVRVPSCSDVANICYLCSDNFKLWHTTNKLLTND